jgi:ribonuclease Z
MEITFLGTGAGVPTPARNVASLALRLPQRPETWLFDCGEGTQHRLLASTVGIGKLRRIFITHLHGDHLFGLPGLLATCGMAGSARPVEVYGPDGIVSFLRTVLDITGTQLPYELAIHTVHEGTVLEDDDLTVTARRLEHRIETYGYRVTERDRPGRLDAARALALGVPDGPMLAQLKRGETIVLADGTVVDGRTLCGAPEPGRSFAYCSDTAYARSAVELARGADLLIHEATFAEDHREIAEASGHATAAMAARTAAEAGAAHLLLTHISSRYGAGELRLLDEARAIFPAAELAYDLMTIEIPRKRIRT